VPPDRSRADDPPPRRGDRDRAGPGELGAPGAVVSAGSAGSAAGAPPGSAAVEAGRGPAGEAGRGPAGEAAGAAGPELARAVLDAALARRRTAPRAAPGARDGGGRRLRGYSGPGPDPRDPQLFGALLDRLVKARGWQKPAAEATVFGAWERVVGADIARHSRPVKLDNGELTVEAESTAWATQLRLLAASLLRSIAAEVGHNVVTKLHIHGPAAPSWNRGPRRVQGRGPRDTYG
jgi:predicted nucleic acid-binding Zn ribbon protein